LSLAAYKDAGKSRAEYDEALAAHVADACPDVIILAGFMHILSPAFLGRFAGALLGLLHSE
jgi:folate-dependent phosphoribosylglycinamide formyltransferase PurN